VSAMRGTRALRPVLFVALLLTGLVAAVVASAADDVDVQVTVDRPRPAQDEIVRLTYTFSGPGAGGNVKGPATLPLKNLVLAGGPSTSTQIVFMNGDLRRSISYTYYLRPQAQGTGEVGETTWSVGEKTLKASAYVIEVGPPDGRGGRRPPAADEDDPFGAPAPRYPFGIPPRVGTGRERAEPQPQREAVLEYVATPDRLTAYVGEDVIVHYELVTQLEVQGLEFVDPPKFPGCWAEDVEKPEKPNGRRDVIQGKGTVMRFTLLKKAVSGLSAGTVTLPAAKVRLAVRLGGDPFDPFGMMDRRVVERSTQPLEIKFLPIPGRAAFKGPVGRFDLSAKVDHPTVAAGEAVTLKVRVAGTGNLRTATEAPHVEVPGAKVYPPTVKSELARGKGGVFIEWDYVVVPAAAGSLTVPPVSLEVFDPSEKKVVTRTAGPIQVAVTAAPAGAAPPAPVAATAGSPAPGSAATVGAATTGSEAETSLPVDPATTSAKKKPTVLDLSRDTVAVPLWVMLAVPGSLLLAGAAAFLLVRQRSGGPFREALEPEPDETKERAAARMDRAVRDRLAARYGFPATVPSLPEALSEAGAPGDLIAATRDLAAELDFLRLAPQLGEYGAKVKDARGKTEKLLRRIR